ncbi:hypothetical protein PLICRDRAFT_109225 [Plicaturopsis crispa FD-325 SS-3]|nr:hypothetical protein PLICRDRAFT_109225 [Plicaturopsis crispa FD-325 SS-3]
MSSSTVYLVSGANRGIGLGLVTSLARRDGVIIFAGVRNPSAAESLQALVKQYPGKVNVVKLTSGNKEENEAVASLIEKTAGRLDVVIANAGINNCYTPVHKTPVEEVREHMEVNLIGTLVLYQAVYPLLKATPSPKFAVISSLGGSIAVGTTVPGFDVLPYGTSKAAVNWVSRKIHYENENFVSFTIHPGSVDTDMAQLARVNIAGADKMPFITVAESTAGILEVIDKATREETGGAFIGYDGTKQPW